MAYEKLYPNTLIVTHQSYSDPLEKTSLSNPPPPRKLPPFGPPSPRNFRWPAVEGMHVFWNYTIQSNFTLYDFFAVVLSINNIQP